MHGAAVVEVDGYAGTVGAGSEVAVAGNTAVFVDVEALPDDACSGLEARVW